MSKPKVLLQLDTDPQPSVFDSVVAVDAGVDQLLRHGGVSAVDAEPLVHGAMFTRGGNDLRQTAIFIGGSEVAAGEALLEKVRRTFFGPVRVSVMMDSSGANTTAAAAVLAAGKHLELSGTTALVLGGTGPVGQRVARLLAREGAVVRVGSRTAARAKGVCQSVAAAVPGARLSAHTTGLPSETAAALESAQLVISAGASGVQLAAGETLKQADQLRVAIDLNAVPPSGLEGIEAFDRAVERNGILSYGAIGVGGMKMKIHKASLQALFEANDRVLDAEEIFEIGRGLSL